MKYSAILPQCHKREMGRKSFDVSELVILFKGTISAAFHLNGNSPVRRIACIMSVIVTEMSSAFFREIREGKSSEWVAFQVLIFLSLYFTSPIDGSCRGMACSVLTGLCVFAVR